jgi:hypothetical protein
MLASGQEIAVHALFGIVEVTEVEAAVWSRSGYGVTAGASWSTAPAESGIALVPGVSASSFEAG